MSAKFVWGVVLIALGVVAVISGFKQIGEIAQLVLLFDDHAVKTGAMI